MKRAGQVLKQMGFRKDAPESLKEAFVRHLIKSATGVDVAPGPNEAKAIKIERAVKGMPVQLEFNFTESLAEKIEIFDSEKNKPAKKSS